MSKVDKIIASFNRTISKLETVAEDSQKEYMDMSVKADIAKEEAHRASTIVGKLNSIFSV